MTKVFFTSDLHFDHKRILELCGRPFGTIEEMNKTLIENWNAKVAPGDTVYLLGDFAFAKTKERVTELLHRLHGTKHLIKGNHDHKIVCKAKGWNSVETRRDVRINGIPAPFVLDHFPIEIWNKRHYGSIHLFGHIHARTCETEKQLRHNVSVDLNGFAPVSAEEIVAMMEARAGFAMDKEWGENFQASILFDQTIPHFDKRERAYYEEE